jgi:hypothetical protein
VARALAQRRRADLAAQQTAAAAGYRCSLLPVGAPRSKKGQKGANFDSQIHQSHVSHVANRCAESSREAGRNGAWARKLHRGPCSAARAGPLAHRSPRSAPSWCTSTCPHLCAGRAMGERLGNLAQCRKWEPLEESGRAARAQPKRGDGDLRRRDPTSLRRATRSPAVHDHDAAGLWSERRLDTCVR